MRLQVLAALVILTTLSAQSARTPAFGDYPAARWRDKPDCARRYYLRDGAKFVPLHAAAVT
jgi:hypothetical protein